MHQAQAVVTMARKGIPYSRFSGKKQEAGDSQRRQDALAEQAAREEGVELDRSLTLSDKGISAYRGDNWKRGDLGKFLDLVDAGVVPKGSILIIEQANRLSRLPWMEQVQLWKEILGRGIVIRTCVPPSRYTKENMNELAVGCPVVLFMMLANLESKQKSDWVRQAWGQKKKLAEAEGTPHGRHCPAWLVPVTVPHPKDSTRTVTLRYEIIEERADVVRHMYQLALEGWGACRIARQLNADGVRPWVKPRRATHPTWNVCAVNYILRAPETFGEYQRTKRQEDGRYVSDGPPVANYYPAILTEETHRAVQAARRRRIKHGGRPGRGGVDTSLFTHLVFEAVSRRPMQCVQCATRYAVYHYLHTDPRGAGIPYRPFERAVLDAVARLKPKDVDGRHEADALTARVEQLQEEHTRLVLDLEDFERQMRELPQGKRSKRGMAIMADLEVAIDAKAEELRAAKEAGATTSRTEALTEIKECIRQLLDDAHRGDPKREAAIRSRIKLRLPFLLESAWVRVQVIDKSKRYVHVQLYLHGDNRPRYFPISCGDISGHAPWQLKDVDFRAGDVGRDAVATERGAQLCTEPLAS
jgi:DNA invertase Pin-like site-specific DNA recombinase